MMHRRRRLIAATFLGVIVSLALLARMSIAGPKSSDAPATRPSSDEKDNSNDSQDDSGKGGASATESSGWHKLKSYSGNAKQKPYEMKFQPGSARFRVKLSVTKIDGASYTKFLANLMECKAVDTDGKPASWGQRAALLDRPGAADQEFDAGVDRNGQPKWFAVIVTGYGAKYEVLVEDHAAVEKKISSKKKSK